MKYIIYFLLLGIIGCSTLQKTATKSHVTDKSKINTAITTEQYKEFSKDTLRGVVPLPKLTRKPVNLTFGSSGTQLQLQLSDSLIRYQATSKTNAKTYKKTNATKQEAKNVKKDNKRTFTNRLQALPWYTSGAIVAGLVLLLFISIKLKNFLKLKSWI